MSCDTPYFYEEHVELPLKCPQDATGFALDIGSSLVKLAYVTENTGDVSTVRCLTFEGQDLDAALAFIKENVIPKVAVANHKFAQGCGLGAVLNRDKIKKAIGSRLHETSEHACVSKGFHFAVTKMNPDKVMKQITELHLHKVVRSTKAVPVGVPARGGRWTYHAELEASMDGESEAGEVKPHVDITHPVTAGVPAGGAHWINPEAGGGYDMTNGDQDQMQWPCLICNLGSQFIYTLVDADGIGTIVHRSERGGLYFHSLGRLLTKASSFKELKAIAATGRISKASRCLEDLPDECHSHFDLQAVEEIQKLVNCAILTDPFSKVVTDGVTDVSKEDMARTLHATLCNEVLSFTNILSQLHGVSTLYFTGNFIRDNKELKHHIQMAPVMDKVLQNPMTPKAVFMRHCGYLGAIGALILGVEKVQHGW
ncbi:uncharacterized protein LOC135494861 [Lineus longissimus]|uniref:uncharacterized protein LOC135494861 n=1 Tax=Lineus longissimus TaxID=88925 RepID=UPI002B4E0D6D